MIVKEALLENEKERVIDFLKSHSLDFDNNVDTTLYLEDDNKIIGTISKDYDVIKCVAIDQTYQGENIASILIDKIVEKLNLENIYSYYIYTKPSYELVFCSLGFSVIAKTSDAIMLEKGLTNIYFYLENTKRLIKNNLGDILNNSDIASCVLNANPFTYGHQYLVEEMSKKHDYVFVFIVESDKSMFSFKERYSMAYLSLSRFKNVLLIPSGKYCVSTLTFPTYFIHDDSILNKTVARLDALIFKNYFMKYLHISKRYVGEESKDYMVTYNATLKEVLGEDLIVLDRYKMDGSIVSASKVRELISENKIDLALNFIPNESKMVFKNLSLNKINYENK